MDENTEGSNTGMIDTDESVVTDASNYLVYVVQIVTHTDLVDSKPHYVEPNKVVGSWNHSNPIQIKK